jgi:hypothetical protein
VRHLELANLSKLFGSTRAVHELSLHVDRGEILLFWAERLRQDNNSPMIAGLEVPVWIYSVERPQHHRTSRAYAQYGNGVSELPCFHLDVFEKHRLRVENPAA